MASRTKRSFSVTLGLDDDGATALDSKIDFLQNAYFGGTKTRNELVGYLFQFAVSFHWARVKAGIGPTDEDRIEIEGLPEISLVYDMVGKLKKKQQVIDLLIEVYENVGLDEFVVACEEYGIDWESVLVGRFTFHTTSETWTAKARRCLASYLQDREQHTVDSIRSRATEDGLIEKEMDWNKLKVLAHREGYSSAGDYGKWKRDN